MCYNINRAKAAIEYARKRGNFALAEKLQDKIEQIIGGPLFYASAFAFPQLLVFTNELPFEPQGFSWGLIPSWAKDASTAKAIRLKTLNARSETMFDLPSFKVSAKSKRCLIYVDGFYEYHTQGKKKFPFRIIMANDEPMILGGLWSEWVDKETGEIKKTATICTTSANSLMAKIHNQPASADTPRMPVILTEENQDAWLNAENKEDVLALAQPLKDGLLKAYTVGPLAGKIAKGNVPETIERVEYNDMELELEK